MYFGLKLKEVLSWVKYAGFSTNNWTTKRTLAEKLMGYGMWQGRNRSEQQILHLKSFIMIPE